MKYPFINRTNSHTTISKSKNPNSDVAEEKEEPRPLKETMSSKSTIRLWPQTKARKILLVLLLLIGLFLGLSASLLAYSSHVVKDIITNGRELQDHAQNAYNHFKTQNLPEADESLQLANQELEKLSYNYQRLSVYRSLPVLKDYFIDGENALTAAAHGFKALDLALKAITPYADVLGLEGEGSFEGGTVEDRVGIMLQTLDMISPELDQIEQQLNLAENSLLRIDASRYPEEIRGHQLKSRIEQAQGMIQGSMTVFSEFRPVIEQLPSIAGGQGERRKYLILFQNNNELRPTGGFLTAYSIIFIEDGKVYPEKSDDIYQLDQRFNQRIQIPEKLGRYLTTEKYWNLRDMNISPDFKESMSTFYEHYQMVRGEPDDLDGIIAVDTHVLTNLLRVLGPVEVPGFGTFSAEIDSRCDCPQVVYALSEIITRPTPYHREDRKGILGPMMQAILQKTYGAPKQHWPELFSLLWDSVQGRHVQMYFFNEADQLAAENAGAAGRLQAPDSNSDFFAIVDANLGGAKSNLFTEYSVNHYVDGPNNGFLSNRIEITYRNTRKADNCNLEAGLLCLNAPAPTWHRLYIPKNAKLRDAQGFVQQPEFYQELGFSVVDGFFRLDPLGVAKIRISYELEWEEEAYRLNIWKQGGVKPFSVLLDVNTDQQELLVNRDITFTGSF